MPVLRSIFLLVFVVSLLTGAWASHVEGIEINYKRIGTDQYLVKYSIRKICGAVNFSTLPITASDGTNSVVLVSPTQVSVRDISMLGPGCLQTSNCFGSGNYVHSIVEAEFADTLDLSGYSTCEWRLSVAYCCRNSAITTGQASNALYSFATLNRCVNNSAPEFLYDPLEIICSNQDLSYSFEVIDTADWAGDSFSYHLVTEYSAENVPATYSGNFSPSKPMTFYGFPNSNLQIPAGFRLNPVTGELNFRPMQPNQMGVVCVEVREWRMVSGVMTVIGTIRRSLNLLVVTCPVSNKAPSFVDVPDVLELCVKDSLCIDFHTSDEDDDSTYIYWNGGLPGGTFSTTNGQEKNATGTFCWKPIQVQVSDTPYTFILQVTDNRCPQYAEKRKVVRVYVRDSVDGPEVTCSPDIIDSTGLDSFFVTASVTNDTGKPYEWSSRGDGYFSHPDSLEAWYYPGPQDKKTCNYYLYFRVVDSAICLGNSHIRDSLEVRQQFAPLKLSGPLVFFAGDSVQLMAAVDTSRARLYRWYTAGDGIFSDTLSAYTWYHPGDSDLFECGTDLTLLAYQCGQDTDRIQLFRQPGIANAGPDRLIQSDTAFLRAYEDNRFGQKGYWRSLGDGHFGDSNLHETYYLPGQQDWSSCEVNLIWEELPKSHCRVNADTLVLELHYSGLDAGIDQSINKGDSVFLHGGPETGPGPFGYWYSLGDGHFIDSTEPAAVYIPGTQDMASCGTSLVWKYPYPQCSSAADTLDFSITYTAQFHGGGNQTLTDFDPVHLSGVGSSSEYPAWWSTLGDGRFTDSTDPNAGYIPGDNDLATCSNYLVWHSVYPQCAAQNDTIRIRYKFGYVNAGPAVKSKLGNPARLTALPLNPGERGWWTTNGDGTFSDSSDPYAYYYPGEIDWLNCRAILTWQRPYNSCSQAFSHTTIWTREKHVLDAGADSLMDAPDSIVLHGSVSADTLYWYSSGTGWFDAFLNYSCTYYLSEEDKQRCEIWFRLNERLASKCFGPDDDVQYRFNDPDISLVWFEHDPCSFDSLYFEVDWGDRGAKNLIHTGNGTLRFNSDSTSFWYRVDEWDLSREKIDFFAEVYLDCGVTRKLARIPVVTEADIRYQWGLAGKVWAYPNPSSGFVEVQSGCPVNVYEIEIFDLRGRSLQVIKVQELPFRVNLEKYAPGNYLLRVKLEEGRYEIIPLSKW